MLSPHATKSVCHAADASQPIAEESGLEPVSEQTSMGWEGEAHAGRSSNTKTETSRVTRCSAMDF
jgi:hypothetical protein